MKIFYLNVIELNKGWGAEWFIDQGFKKLGHKTINLDFRKHRKHLCQKFLEVNDDFDVMFLQRGQNFPLPLVKAINRPRFFYASELFSRKRDQDALMESGLFDHVFVKSYGCRDYLLDKGWLKEDQISIFLNGFDSSLHRKMPEPKKDIDVLFVANLTDRRKKILKEMEGKINIHYANVYGEEMVRLVNRAKIVLNIHASENLDTETRVYETLGSGSFLLTEKLNKENPFKDKEHLVQFNSLADLVEKANYYLGNEDEREEIAGAGHYEAQKNHSFDARARQLVSVFQKYLLKTSKKSPIDIGIVEKYKKRQVFDNAVIGLKEKYYLLKRKARSL